MLPKCHICGKSGLYTEMKDHVIFSVHPKCERGLVFLTSSPKGFQNCSLCKSTNLASKVEFKSHLIDYHTKESLAEFIVNAVNKI